MEENQPHPYLDKLLKRPIVKPKKEFIVNIKRQPIISDDKGDNTSISGLEEIRNKVADPVAKIEFVDERDSNIDRELILAKMREHMGVFNEVKTVDSKQYNVDVDTALNIPSSSVMAVEPDVEQLETDQRTKEEPVDIHREKELREELATVFDGVEDNPEKYEIQEETVDRKIVKRKPLAKQTLKVENELIQQMHDRLPPPDKIVFRVSNHYMENRKMYVQKLSELFKEYNKELLDEESNISCDPSTRSDKEQLMIHQRVAREYLNLYTPYRGLLLYYGLGAGKTLASIAIAEGMKSHKKIVLMTPASLKSNYMTELKKYGEQLYRKNQYWEFISTEGRPEYVAILSSILSLKREFIVKNKGAFLVDVSKKESNFQDLEPRQQQMLDLQLEEMIRAKYLDINYNGLNDRIFNEMSDNGKKNPFDNSVVVIDEAHNLVSWIVNKLKKPRSMASKMYDYLMDAENARIVLLSGTPVINYPNEIAVLFNILRGYIKTWEFQITSKNFDKDQLLEYFDKENFRVYDYIDYTNGKLTITRNPFGFINTKRAVNSTKEVVVSARKKEVLEYEVPKTVVKRKNKPDVGDIGDIGEETKPAVAAVNAEVDEKTEANKVEDEGANERAPVKKTRAPVRKTIKKKEELIESATVDQKGGSNRKTQKKDKSIDELFEIKDGMVIEKYHEPILENGEKQEEIDREMRQHFNNMGEMQGEMYKGGCLFDDNNSANNKMKGGDVLVSSQYKGVYFKDEQGNISDTAFLNKIKQILTKYEVTFAPTIQVQKYKCLPDDPDAFNALFVDKDSQIVKNANLFKKRILGLTSYFRSAQEGLLPNFILDDNGSNYHMEYVEMSDHQFKEYTKYRVAEIKEQDRNALQRAKKGDKLEEISGTYRIYSRSACNFSFPDAVKRPMPDPKRKAADVNEGEAATAVEEEKVADVSLDNMKLLENYDIEKPEDEIQESDEEPVHIPESYAAKIKHAMDMILSGANMDPHPLSREGLAIYSPKFLRMIEHVSDEKNRGMHLIYSDFLTLEGINMFKLVLEHNGYAEFKIKKVGSEWDIEGWENEETRRKPKFMLYTGQATTQEKEILRNIWNSDWKFVPTSIVNKIETLAETNKMGEIARVLMITAAGAEGINLKNTRFVHIMESYWNMVRIDQVVGRARRICSHYELAKEYQNVKVFYYLSTFSKKQIEGKENKDVMVRDVDKKGHPITTDEYLYMKSVDKDFLNRQLLKAVKETAIDCNLYSKTRESEKLVCYGFGKVKSNDFSSFPQIEEDEKVRDELNVKEQKLELKKIVIKKDGKEIRFIQDGEFNVYDNDVYENSGMLVPLGKLVPRGRGRMFVPIQPNV